MENKMKIAYQGLWAELKAHCLQAEHPETFQKMLREQKLSPYLERIEEEYSSKFSALVEETIEREQITEDLKASDPIEWVRSVNNIRSKVTEILREELCH